MTRARFLILSIGLVTVPTTGVLGQSANGLNCQNVRNYLSCALQAAGIAELASTTVAQGERELRFWITSGNMMPEKLLVLRQHGDSASGRLLLIWRGRTMELPFASSVCLDRWSNAAGGLCVGRLREAQDWVAIAQRLDRAGLAQVPRAPVPEQPCDRTPTPPSAPGQLPIDHLCAAMADGFDHALELRTSAGYWRYQFPRIPDSTAVGAMRDRLLLEILTCASRYVVDGPCRGAIAP